MGRSCPHWLFQINFTVEDLYDKDKVDIEHVVMEEVFQLLQCVLPVPSRRPLSTKSRLTGSFFVAGLFAGATPTA